MRMQALLVRERILGPAHPDTSYYIRYRGAVYADMGHFERCITLWMYALDMQQKMLEPLSPMTQSSLLSFAELFSYMMSEGRNRNNNSNQRRYVNILYCYTHVTFTVKWKNLKMQNKETVISNVRLFQRIFMQPLPALDTQIFIVSILFFPFFSIFGSLYTYACMYSYRAC